MVWHEMQDFSEDCILMVLASDYYEEEDYIRDYKDYKMIFKRKVIKRNTLYMKNQL